jgi:CRP-like cAMP-binding protein/Fe-S-cluster-containing hydrogenase component 2
MNDLNQPIDVARLRAYPFFEKLSDGVLKRLQPNVSERQFAAGEFILRAGAYSDAAYYIADGIVEMVLPAAGAQVAVSPGDRGAYASGTGPTVKDTDTIMLLDMPVDVSLRTRTLLQTGEVFGEAGALSRYPVSVDVIAASEARCLLIGTPALRLMLDRPELADFKAFIDQRYRDRTLRDHLCRVELFAALDPGAIERLRSRAELVAFKPGQVIVEQGTPADALYLVRGGYVKVGLRAGEQQLAVTYLRKGDYAGEIALMLDEPWPFSLSALEHVELVRISREEFTRLLAEYPPVEQQLWETAVQRLKQRGSASRNPLSSQYLQMAMDTGLIHGESVLLIDLESCTRCDDCVRACADTHGGTPRFVREGLKFKHFSVPTACYQCTDPVCMIGCPTGAITRPLGTLEVTINKDTCIGCGNCSRRCPWGNIQTVPFDSPTLNRHIDLATKCDLCLGRKAGPACVQMCPHGAAIRVSFKDLDHVADLFSR